MSSLKEDIKNEIKDSYFKWLYNYMCEGRTNKYIQYKYLFTILHSIPFKYTIKNDVNRAADGVDLRNRFIDEMKYDEKYLDYLRAPCSVLEMIIALAIRCEETIMYDTRYGNRYKQWFWSMLKNLQISQYTDEYFTNHINSEQNIVSHIYNFLDHNYRKDGLGGLFYIRDCEEDMRDIEIWTQMCWYLNNIGD